MNYRAPLVTAALIASIALTGCNVSDTGTVNEGGATGVAADGSKAPAATEEAKPKVARLGIDSVTMDNGLVISVSKPARYRPSDTAAGHQAGNTAIVITVKITNKSVPEPFDLSLVTATAAFGADGVQGEDIIDSAKGVMGMFEGKIAKGQSRSVKMAFSAATKDTSKIAITVRPGMLEGEALFEGKL